MDENLNVQMESKTTLGPAYNEHFDSYKSAHSSQVLVVTEHFNIVVNEIVSAWHKIICSLYPRACCNRTRFKRDPL